MNRLWMLMLLVALLVWIGCQGEEETSTLPSAEMQPSDEERIRSLTEAFDEAFNREDADALAELYAIDGVRMDARAPPSVGREAIRTAFAGAFEGDDVHASNRISELSIAGDVAVIQGSTVSTRATDNGDTVERYAKWITILRRQADESWKVVENIWNYDESATGNEGQ